jgi:hypothetical protein
MFRLSRRDHKKSLIDAEMIRDMTHHIKSMSLVFPRSPQSAGRIIFPGGRQHPKFTS